MRKSLSMAGTLLAASTALSGLAVLGVSGTAWAYSCGNQPSQISDGYVNTGVFLSGGSRIRSGPSTNCVALGVGYSSHRARLDCWVLNTSDGYFYDHVRDLTTGVSGWTREDVLNRVAEAACNPYLA